MCLGASPCINACKVRRTKKKTHDSEKEINKASGGNTTLDVKRKHPEKYKKRHVKKEMLKGVKAKRQKSGNEDVQKDRKQQRGTHIRQRR